MAEAGWKVRRLASDTQCGVRRAAWTAQCHPPRTALCGRGADDHPRRPLPPRPAHSRCTQRALHGASVHSRRRTRRGVLPSFAECVPLAGGRGTRTGASCCRRHSVACLVSPTQRRAAAMRPPFVVHSSSDRAVTLHSHPYTSNSAGQRPCVCDEAMCESAVSFAERLEGTSHSAAAQWWPRG